MVPPTRGLSESSLTRVADMIKDAFGDDGNNIVNFGFIHAILLLLTKRLCLLDRTVAVKVHPAHVFQYFPNYGANITVGELKVIATREKKRKRPNEITLHETTDTVHKAKKRKAPESDDTASELEGLDDEVSSKVMEARKEDSQRPKPISKSNKTEPSTGFNTDNNDGSSINEGSKQSKQITKDKSNKKEDSVGNKTEDDKLSPNEISKQPKQLGGINNEEIQKIDIKVVPIAPESLKEAQSVKEKRVKDNDPSGAIETYQEKILVVERRASTESSKTSRSTGYALNQTPESLVTKDQFQKLANAVKKLQERFGPIDSELLEGLYRKSSLSEPMAVIQLSARLEAVERAIDDMMNSIRNFSSTGYNFPATATNLPSIGYNLPETAETVESTVYNLPATANNLPSTGHSLPPSAGYSLPAAANNLPSTGYSLPATANNLPSTGYNFPGTANNLPSTDNNLPSTANNLPSTGYNLPVTANNLPSTGYSLPPTANSLPSTGYSLPAAANNLPSTGYSLPATANNLPSTGYNMPVLANNLPSTGYNLPATAKNLPSTGYNLPATANNLPSTGYNLPATATSNIPEEAVKTLIEENVRKNFSILMEIKVLGANEVEALRAPSIKSMREYSKDSKDSKVSIRKKTDAFSISASEFGSDLLKIELESTSKVTPSMISSIKLDDDITKPLTMEQFRLILQKVSGEMATRMQRQCDPISLKSTQASKDGTFFDNRLTKALDKAQTIPIMENKVKQFVEGVTKLDSRFSSRTAYFYSVLETMQSEVDLALENMADAMSKPSPDNEAIPQLHHNINTLLNDIQKTNDCQEELLDDENNMEKRLEVIRRQIHHLDHAKANRDEIDEALKSKISLTMINGLMNLDHFNALIGQLQKYINDLFQHIFTRECSWQKHIENLWDTIDAKANTSDETALMNDIYKNISKMDEYLEFMISICSKNGIKSKNDKEITRKEPCISCDTAPIGGPDKLFENRKTEARTESLKSREINMTDDENKICRLKFPIPHPIHPGYSLTDKQTVNPDDRVFKLLNDLVISLIKNWPDSSVSRAELSNCAKFCVRPYKTSKDKIAEELASNIIVRSSKRGETVPKQKVTSEEMRPCEPCYTSEWKKIILNHNLKLSQQPKSQPFNKQPTLVPQTPQRYSKESDASLPIKSKRGSAKSRKCLNNSHPRVKDSDSEIAETIIVLNLDEEEAVGHL